MPTALSDMLDRLFGGGGASDERLAGFLMAAGVALMTLFLLRRLWRRYRRQGVGEVAKPTARERIARTSPTGRHRETLETLMVEVQELTRVCAAQMENRALRLERLIREADERVRALEACEGRAAGPERLEEGMGGRGRAGFGRMPRVTTVGQSPGSRAASIGGSLLVEDEVDPLTRRVYGLADQGLTPVEIAGRLEEQIGKVELILALRGH